jgi:hypothetical protein
MLKGAAVAADVIMWYVLVVCYVLLIQLKNNMFSFSLGEVYEVGRREEEKKGLSSKTIEI